MALFFISTIIATLFLVVIIFSSKRLSPIPYFPSNKKDLPLIIKALNLKNNQVIYDLGAGDGIVIFEAAKESFQRKLSTKFVAVEINPILLGILYLRRFLHPNKKNINILKRNIFSMDFNSITRKRGNSVTIYLYISPWFLEPVIKNLKSKIIKFNVVSYMYPVAKLDKKVKIKRGVSRIFIYD